MADLHHTIWTALLCLEFGNSILHGIGSYLLFYLYKKRENSNSQTLFLLNLACSELLYNIIACSRDLLGIRSTNHPIAVSSLNIALSTGSNYLYILSMLYLTGDRLFHISLHLRYAQYWNVRKTKILLSFTWCFNVVFGIAFPTIVVNTPYEEELNWIFPIYVTSFLLTLYLIFAVTTYIVLFRVYARSERRLNSQLKTEKRKCTTFVKIFVNSRFRLSVILIGSYLVFTVVPCLLRTILHWIDSTNQTVITYVTYYYVLSTRISFTIDGVIYIFLQKDVRHLLYQKLCFNMKSRNGRVFPKVSIIEMEPVSVRRDTVEVSGMTDASVASII